MTVLSVCAMSSSKVTVSIVSVDAMHALAVTSRVPDATAQVLAGLNLVLPFAAICKGRSIGAKAAAEAGVRGTCQLGQQGSRSLEFYFLGRGPGPSDRPGA